MRKDTLKEHSQFDRKYWILNTASLLNSQFIGTIIPTFIFVWAFLSEKDNILSDEKSTLRHISLTFIGVELCKRPERTVNHPFPYIYKQW